MKYCELFVTALGICLVLGCEDITVESPAAEPAAPSSDFKWVPVQPGAAAEPESHPARVLWTGDSQAVVSAPLVARIIHVAVKPGDKVERGDAIVTVVMPDLDAAVASAEAARLSLEVLQQRQARLSALQSKGLVRASELAQLRLDIAGFKAQRLKSVAVMKGAGFKSGGRVRLVSPMAGVVTDVDAVVGQLRRPDDRPLARIQSPQGQRIEANLTARPPENARFVLSTVLGEAELSVISFAPKTGGIGYRVWLEPTEQSDLPVVSEGLLQVSLNEAKDSWLLPAAAVGKDAAGSFAVIVESRQGTPKRISVSVVRSARGSTLVRGSLATSMFVAMDPRAAAATLESAP